MKGRGGRTAPYRFSLNGAPDIAGLIGPWGVGLGIEVKRDLKSSQQSDAQVAYEQMSLTLGAVYFVARSADHAVEQLDQSIALLIQRFPVITR
jgi:hypothetical protein